MGIRVRGGLRSYRSRMMGSTSLLLFWLLDELFGLLDSALGLNPIATLVAGSLGLLRL